MQTQPEKEEGRGGKLILLPTTAAWLARTQASRRPRRSLQLLLLLAVAFLLGMGTSELAKATPGPASGTPNGTEIACGLMRATAGEVRVTGAIVKIVI